MILTWTRAPRRRRAAPCLIPPVVCLLSVLLYLAGTPASGVRAQAGTGDGVNVALTAPIADVLSAATWLWTAGLDPRNPAARLGVAAWGASGERDATPVASTSGPGREVIVSRQAGLIPVSSEPSLAVDPANPDHLVLAVSALDLPAPATYVSDDGGASWAGPFQASYFPRDTASAGAPALAFGRDGNVYLVFRSLGLERVSVGAWSVTVERSRIVVSRSDDGGRSWGEPVPVASAAIDAALAPDETGRVTGGLAFDLLDSPAIAIGPDPNRPEREIITVAYTEFRLRFVATDAPGIPPLASPAVETTIRVARSGDGGRSWSEPVAVSPTALRATGGGAAPAGGEPEVAVEQPPPSGPPAAPTPPPATAPSEGDQVVQGPVVGALADGTVVVAYLDTTRDGPHQGLATIMVARSEDGGRTFAEPVQAGVFREIALQPRTAFFRWWDGAFPRLAVGPGDTIAIVVSARPEARAADDGDILLFRSLDGGASWEEPVPVGGGDDGAPQFFPALAFAPDGALHVIWGELGGEPAGAGYEIVATRSPDLGVTWDVNAAAGTARLSAAPANALLGFPGGRYLGGRLALIATGGETLAAWPDTRLASPGKLWQQIAFARGS